jgi:Xaa-Pro aminopeptidase
MLAMPDTSIRSYRHNALRAYVLEHGLDAVAFTSADWFEWSSNHVVREQAWERPFLLVVTADGRSFGFLATQSRLQIEIAKQDGMIWIDDIDFYTESPRSQNGEWSAPQWADMVAAGFIRHGLARAHLGVDTVSGPLRRVEALLPSLRLSQLGVDIRALRWRKHAQEIATMQSCAALSDWGMGIARSELTPGRNLAEADLAIAARITREAANRFTGQDFAILSLTTLSGAASACPKGPRGMIGRVLEQDNTAVTTIVLKLDGLAMEQARTWIVGRPPDESLHLLDVARNAQESALSAMVPGRPVSYIHRAAQQVFDAHGLGEHLRLRAGHGIGIVIHDYPEDLPFEQRPLNLDEVLVAEPSLFIAGRGGFRFADVAVVREDGPERLTRAAKTNADLVI